MGAEWFQSFFDEFYDALHGDWEAANAAAEAAAVGRLLALKPGWNLLDVPCGSGRHAVEFAAAGLHVAGVDLLQRRLDQARCRAKQRGVSVDFRTGDMRSLPWQGAFDAVVNLFNSFGYFDETGDTQALASMLGALRPRGLLLLDLPNRDYYVQQVPPADWFETDRHWVLCAFHFDPVSGIAETQYTFVPKGGGSGVPVQRNSRMRWYTATELTRLAEATGGRIAALYGDLQGTAFSAESPRMVAVLRRGH